MTINATRIEYISNVVTEGSKFRLKGVMNFIHDTVIIKSVTVDGDLKDCYEEALSQKDAVESNIKKILKKIQDKVPSSKVFKHDFE